MLWTMVTGLSFIGKSCLLLYLTVLSNLGTRQPYILEYSTFLRFLYMYHRHAVANFLHVTFNQTGQDKCEKS